MKLRPLHDRVVVRPDPEETSVGGILLPETAQETPLRGKVIAKGPGRFDEKGRRVPMQSDVGDTVLYPPYAGAEIEHDGHKLLLLHDDELLATEAP